MQYLLNLSLYLKMGFAYKFDNPDGIDLGKMDGKLLQKIEELTLYVLELKKQNEKQDQLIADLMKKTEKK